MSERFESISPADFFYRNREIAGFDNPSRSTYTIIRELVENSLDSCESHGFLPDINIKLKSLDGSEGLLNIWIKDNGGGVPPKYIPQAFGQVLFGSKYRLRQTRGIFGLGGKMAILYGQITAHSTVKIYSSTINSHKTYFYELSIDISKNKPIIVKRKVFNSGSNWHGLVLTFNFIGDYQRSKRKILDYLWQTSIAVPYAQITFIDISGKLYFFSRKIEKMPPSPREVLPHPHGIDIEMLKRLINASLKRDPKMTLKKFLIKRFQRVGEKTAEDFLKFANLSDTQLARLKRDELLKLAEALKKYNKFKSPDASKLSPIGPEYFYLGIKEATDAEFVHVVQRPPSSYEGHPFIVETAIAYGGNIEPKGNNDVNLYRFANKIPLLYDAHNDVSMKIIKSINWKAYRIKLNEAPVAFFVHVCSTKVPYKTVGKEYIADQPKVARQIELGLRENARKLSIYIGRKEKEAARKARAETLRKYLSKIAIYSTILAGQKTPPNISKLFREVITIEHN